MPMSRKSILPPGRTLVLPVTECCFQIRKSIKIQKCFLTPCSFSETGNRKLFFRAIRPARRMDATLDFRKTV